MQHGPVDYVPYEMGDDMQEEMPEVMDEGSFDSQEEWDEGQ